MIVDPQEFSDMFLTGVDLENVICHMCNQSAGLVSDPITETLMIMATTPVCVVFTEAGLAMFRDKPTMVMPYMNMTPVQLMYIKKIVENIVEATECKDNNIRGQVQMGGGCIILIPMQKTKWDFIIDKEKLMKAFVTSIDKSKDYNNWTKRALCSIIMQRLSCSTNISKESMRKVSAISDSLFTEA